MRVGWIKSAVVAFAFAAFPAHASVIAIFGTQPTDVQDRMTAFLDSQGHQTKNFGSSVPTDLAGYDVVIALREAGNDAVAKFVLGGGLLITEWDASVWALNTASLLQAKDNGGGEIQPPANQIITITDKGLGLGLGNGLKNPFSDNGRTEFARTLLFDEKDVDLLGTRPGSVIPVMIGGASGDGYVLINGLDWADGFQSGTPTATWLANAVNIQQTEPVPEPGSLALAAIAFACIAFGRRRRARH